MFLENILLIFLILMPISKNKSTDIIDLRCDTIITDIFAPFSAGSAAARSNTLQLFRKELLLCNIHCAQIANLIDHKGASFLYQAEAIIPGEGKILPITTLFYTVYACNSVEIGYVINPDTPENMYCLKISFNVIDEPKIEISSDFQHGCSKNPFWEQSPSLHDEIKRVNASNFGNSANIEILNIINQLEALYQCINAVSIENNSMLDSTCFSGPADAIHPVELLDCCTTSPAKCSKDDENTGYSKHTHSIHCKCIEPISYRNIGHAVYCTMLEPSKICNDLSVDNACLSSSGDDTYRFNSLNSICGMKTEWYEIYLQENISNPEAAPDFSIENAFYGKKVVYKTDPLNGRFTVLARVSIRGKEKTIDVPIDKARLYPSILNSPTLIYKIRLAVAQKERELVLFVSVTNDIYLRTRFKFYRVVIYSDDFVLEEITFMEFVHEAENNLIQVKFA